MNPVAGHQYLLFPPARPLAERFGAEFFREVPESPGVYLMSTARDGVLYVGKAKNLRRRLGSYRSGTGDRLPRKLIRLLLRTERIDWDLCLDEAAALARERELIRALQPRFNRQGVRPPKDWFIGWRRHHDSVTLALDESLEDWPEARGPFAFARPVFAALLRQLWLEAHPGAVIVDLPAQLLNGPVPARWTVTRSEPVERWLRGLESFLAPPPERTQSDPPQPPVPDRDPPIAKAPHEPALRRSPLRRPCGGEGGSSSRSSELEPGEVEHPTVHGFNANSMDAGKTLHGILDLPRPGASFDAQWRALDAECLAEFQARLRRGTR